MASRGGRRARVHRLCGGADFFLGTVGRMAHGNIQRQQAVENIARRYLEWVTVFEGAAM